MIKRSPIGANTTVATRPSPKCQTWSVISVSTPEKNPMCAKHATSSLPQGPTSSSTYKFMIGRTTETSSSAYSLSNYHNILYWLLAVTKGTCIHLVWKNTTWWVTERNTSSICKNRRVSSFMRVKYLLVETCGFHLREDGSSSQMIPYADDSPQDGEEGTHHHKMVSSSLSKAKSQRLPENVAVINSQ